MDATWSLCLQFDQIWVSDLLTWWVTYVKKCYIWKLQGLKQIVGTEDLVKLKLACRQEENIVGYQYFLVPNGIVLNEQWCHLRKWVFGAVVSAGSLSPHLRCLYFIWDGYQHFPAVACMLLSWHYKQLFADPSKPDCNLSSLQGLPSPPSYLHSWLFLYLNGEVAILILELNGKFSLF